MIVSTRNGNAELRLFEASSFIPRPGSRDAIYSGSLKQELTIAAVACAVRLIAETIAGFTLRVYQGDASERRPILDAPQARLFQHPAEGWSSYDVWSDVATALEIEKNAFLWKLKTRKGVEEIWPLNPAYFEVTRDTAGRKTIRARTGAGVEDVTANVIHIRGWTPGAEPSGVSTLELHRSQLRTALDYETYKGAYFDNDGLPGILIEAPGSPTKESRKEILDAWARRHGGARNARRPGIIWGGMKVSAMAPNLRDSQVAELADAIARDVARMFRIYPGDLLHTVMNGKAPNSAEIWADVFWRFSLFPRTRRIERAIASDPDVFPDQSQWPRFDASELVRGDITTQASVAHMLTQVGLLMKDEGRAQVGLGPLPDGQGQTFIETPVGAAPNPDPGAEQLARRIAQLVGELT